MLSLDSDGRIASSCSGNWESIAAAARETLKRYGACPIYNFLDDEARRALLQESMDLRSSASRYAEWYNPYNQIRAASANRHPDSFRSRFSLAVCTSSRIPRHSWTQRIYRAPFFLELLALIDTESSYHRYNDDAAAINVTYMNSGDSVGWHFDTCDFVVALVLQMPTRGGALYFSAEDRSPVNPNFEHVYDVLTRPAAHVHRIPYDEGCCVIFSGKKSLHRIGHVLGPRERVVVLLSYDRTRRSHTTDDLNRVRYRALRQCA